MRLSIEILLDYDLPEPCDVLLQIEAAAMVDQRLLSGNLLVTSPEPLRAICGEDSVGQRTWAAGMGRFVATYSASVEIARSLVALDSLAAAHPRDMPALALPYLFPSRYCESDRFEAFVHREFGKLQGGARILAMRDWIEANVDYVSGASDGNTTAADTFVRRAGVCRDFAHLMASFSRAAQIPARVVSVYAPSVSPPDFHAVVEVWMEGSWHFVDATGMAQAEEMVRICVGRDATDIAFMTVFGSATLIDQRVSVVRV